MELTKMSSRIHPLLQRSFSEKRQQIHQIWYDQIRLWLVAHGLGFAGDATQLFLDERLNNFGRLKSHEVQVTQKSCPDCHPEQLFLFRS